MSIAKLLAFFGVCHTLANQAVEEERVVYPFSGLAPFPNVLKVSSSSNWKNDKSKEDSTAGKETRPGHQGFAASCFHIDSTFEM